MNNFKYTIEALESEEAKDSQPTPVTLALQMSDEIENGVDLVTLDKDQNVELYVLTINPDGTFFRHVSGNFACPSHAQAHDDDHGRLVLDE